MSRTWFAPLALVAAACALAAAAPGPAMALGSGDLVSFDGKDCGPGSPTTLATVTMPFSIFRSDWSADVATDYRLSVDVTGAATTGTITADLLVIVDLPAITSGSVDGTGATVVFHSTDLDGPGGDITVTESCIYTGLGSPPPNPPPSPPPTQPPVRPITSAPPGFGGAFISVDPFDPDPGTLPETCSSADPACSPEVVAVFENPCDQKTLADVKRRLDALTNKEKFFEIIGVDLPGVELAEISRIRLRLVSCGIVNFESPPPRDRLNPEPVETACSYRFDALIKAINDEAEFHVELGYAPDGGIDISIRGPVQLTYLSPAAASALKALVRCTSAGGYRLYYNGGPIDEGPLAGIDLQTSETPVTYAPPSPQPNPTPPTETPAGTAETPEDACLHFDFDGAQATVNSTRSYVDIIAHPDQSVRVDIQASPNFDFVSVDIRGPTVLSETSDEKWRALKALVACARLKPSHAITYNGSPLPPGMLNYAPETRSAAARVPWPMSYADDFQTTSYRTTGPMSAASDTFAFLGGMPVDVWTRTKGAILAGGDGIGGAFTAGIVVGVKPKLDLGVYGTGLGGSIKRSSGVTKLTTGGGGLGLYATYRLRRGKLKISASEFWASHSIDASGTSGRFSSTLTKVDGSYTRTWMLGPGVEVTPTAIVTWTSFATTSYTDSAGTAISAGWVEQFVLSGGLTVARTFLRGGSVVASLRPSLRIQGNVAADQSMSGALPASTKSAFDSSRLTADVTAGLDLTLTGGATVNLSLGANGLAGADDLVNYTGRVNVTLPLK